MNAPAAEAAAGPGYEWVALSVTTLGVRTMLANTGQMLSIAIAFPLVLSQIPPEVMMKIFIFGGGMGNEPAALDEIVHGFADEKVAAILRSERVAAINRRTAGGREVIGSLRDQQGGGSVIIDPAFVFWRGDRDDRLCACERGDAVDVALLDDDLADRDVVEDGKTIPPIVVRCTELRMASDCFDLLRPGTETEVAPAD